MEKICLPITVKRNTAVWLGFWIFELFIGAYLFWMLKSFRILDFGLYLWLTIMLVTVVALYLVYFLIRHSRANLLILDENEICLRAFPQEVSVKWTDISAIFMEKKSIFIAVEIPETAVFKKTHWFEKFSIKAKIKEKYGLHLVMSIPGILLDESAIELAIILEEIWAEKNAGSNKSLLTEKLLEEITPVKKKKRPLQRVLLYVGILFVSFFGRQAMEKFKSTFFVQDRKVYYVVNQDTKKMEFAFVTDGLKYNVDPFAEIVRDDSLNHSKKPQMTKREFDRVQDLSYQKKLEIGQDFTWVPVKQPVLWRLEFDFKKSEQIEQTGFLTLTKLHKALFKDYFEGQMSKDKKPAIPVKIYEAQ